MTRHTNWHIITGAPCSGKTTVICELERMGYRVVHEAARAYIDSQLQKGRTMDSIRGNALEMQQTILHQKLKNEAFLPDAELIFLDRGIPDSIAYYHLSGLDTDEPLKYSREVRYKKILFFERLAFAQDRVRSEDDQTAAKLDTLTAMSYNMLDYELIRVPVLSVRERTEFVLQNL